MDNIHRVLLGYQIDPFSVMGIINRGTTNANRTILAKELANAFDIKVPAPTQFEGIPVLNNKAFDDGFVFGNQRKWTGLYYNGLVLD